MELAREHVFDQAFFVQSRRFSSQLDLHVPHIELGRWMGRSRYTVGYVAAALLIGTLALPPQTIKRNPMSDAIGRRSALPSNFTESVAA